MNGKASLDYPPEALVNVSEQPKGDYVRRVFENAPRYLTSRRVDIRFRMDTVRDYASMIEWERLLDIGCGDGSISLQLLTPSNRLTLMDLSSTMVERVKTNTPHHLAHNVVVRNENFAAAAFDPQPFDIVIAVGVMAHVDSPDAFLAKIKTLLRPGSKLVLEFTDAFHPVGRVGRFWGWLKERIAPAKYSTNKLSIATMSALLKRNDFTVVETFRYSRVPLPGFNRIISHDTEYRMMKAFFGSALKNRNAWLGNEYIFLLSSE
jgi:SAM-dependent methyltransferase